MFDFGTATIIILLLLGMVLLGVHIAVALGTTSVVGIFLVTGKMRIVEATIASTAAEAMRDFTFAVIPLFMLMGEFIGRSGSDYRHLYRNQSRPQAGAGAACYCYGDRQHDFPRL